MSLTEPEEMPSLDLSGYKSRHGAAKAFAGYLRELAEAWGQDGDLEVSLFEPGDDAWIASETGWVVAWEGSPVFEWAAMPEEKLPGLEGLRDGEFFAEAVTGHALAFHHG